VEASQSIPLREQHDIVLARKVAKDLAAGLGFDLLEQVHLATAVSELARNALDYGGGGEVIVRAVEDGRRRGVEFVCRDGGPGVADLERALAGGHSTGGGLGRGLSGARALLDDFDIDTGPGRGTTVRGCKWRA
jgi:serine/threonine-protein kinase RsbT